MRSPLPIAMLPMRDGQQSSCARAAGYCVAALCILLAMASGVRAQPELHTSQEAFPGARLTDIDASGQLIFQQPNPLPPLQPNQIVRWSSEGTVDSSSAIALADGSWLAGQIRWPNEHRVRLVSKWFEAVEMEIDQLRAVMVNASPSWAKTQQFHSQMSSVTGSQDVLFKRDLESASGIVTVQMRKSIDPASPDRAAWLFKPQTATASVEISQADMAGVAFSPILRPAISPGAACACATFIDGSRLFIKEMKRRDDLRVECTLASGLKLLSLDESDQFVIAIAQLTSQPSGVTWMSDLEPARYRLLESESRVPWPLGRNQDLFGKRLLDAKGHVIEHALVMHSPSQAAFRWDGKAARVLGTVEILASPANGSSAPSPASVRCEVLVGRNGQLVSAWKSDILRAGTAPVQVDVDISNSQLIALLVDEADLGTLGDHVMWRDLRIVSQ